jgi:hypothetical protein
MELIVDRLKRCSRSSLPSVNANKSIALGRSASITPTSSGAPLQPVKQRWLRIKHRSLDFPAMGCNRDNYAFQNRKSSGPAGLQEDQVYVGVLLNDRARCRCWKDGPNVRGQCRMPAITRAGTWVCFIRCALPRGLNCAWAYSAWSNPPGIKMLNQRCV